jgi:cation diffusion facilitator family transporter
MFAAMVLMVAAIGIAVDSFIGLDLPQVVPKSFTLYVLIAVIITKEIMYRQLLAVGIATGSTALQSDAWHHRSDALTSLCALLGISAALAGGPEYAVADEYGAIGASCFMLIQGLRLFSISIKEIMDTQASPEFERSIRQAAVSIPGVESIDKCRVRKSGFDHIVEIHICVDGQLSVREGHILAHNVKDLLKASDLGILEAIVHVEPVKVD